MSNAQIITAEIKKGAAVLRSGKGQPAPVASAQSYTILRKIITVQSYAILLLIGLSFLAATVFSTKYAYHLIVKDKDGAPHELKNIIPLAEPNLTRTAITNLALSIATQIQTFGFNNADERLIAMKKYFSEEAWNQFVKAYLSQGVLDTIKTNQQVLTSIATNGAVITKEGLEEGRYQWVVQVPMLVTIQVGRKVETKRTTLEVTFVRASTLKYAQGLMIDSWSQR